jgi:phosphoesterase RecJ-like protein
MYTYMMNHLGAQHIDAAVAQCIYTGLVTDTGSFRYDSTSSNTIRTAASLLDLGAKPSEIYDKIFDQNRLEKLQLLGYFLSEKIEVISNGRVALCHLTFDELKRFNVRTGDTEGFVNYGLSIVGVKMSALIIDRGPLVKMSFRSKGSFPCNEFSREYFGGGGHLNAAGGASKLTLEKTIEKFKQAIEAYEDHL